MPEHSTRRGSWTAACCLSALVAAHAGCSQFETPDFSNPFAKKPPTVAQTDPLNTLRSSQNPAERVEALSVLRTSMATRGPDEQAQLVADVQLLLQRERDPFLRAEAMRSVSGCNVPQVEDLFQQCTLDAHPAVRVACCRTLAERRNGPALAVLSRLAVEDADIDVRLEALKGLAKFEGNQATPALAAALDDSNPAVQYRAMQSLSAATKQELGSDVQVWKDFLAGKPAAPKNTSFAERFTKPWF